MRTEYTFSSGVSASETKQKRHKMAKFSSTPINQGWTFKQADKKDAEFLPVAQFPTNVHLDLIANNIIADPFIGKNENDVQWVGEVPWVYKTTFSSPTVQESDRAIVKAVINFEGLDTYATVLLNGKEILKTESMFTPERVDVTTALKKEGDNELEITFESAYLKGCQIVEQHPNHHWGCWNGDTGRLAVRKAQYHWVSDSMIYGHVICS
jgi:beta-mannosidase